MNAKLIYHTPETAAGGVSPFDAAIMEMVEDQDLRMACPYLGLDYLQRIVARSDSWRLLTDVGEWLASHSRESRSGIVDFILANSLSIRHCPSLHAKVIVAGSRALIGSANFTNKGIKSRVEMAVLFEGVAQVEEARIWFDRLWDKTEPVREHDLKDFVAILPPPSLPSEVTMLPSAFAGVSSKWAPLVSDAEIPGAERREISQVSQIFAANLAAVMKIQGISQAELGRRTNGKPSKINAIVKRKQNPSLDRAEELAHAVGYELHELLAPDFTPAHRAPIPQRQKKASSVFLENLNYEMDAQVISQSAIARQIGINQTNISVMIRGAQKLGLNRCYKASRAVGYDLHEMLVEYER